MIFSSDTLLQVFFKFCPNITDLQSNMLTISMNINFNKIVETSNLQQSYTQYLYSIQIIKNNYLKLGPARVNTISSVYLIVHCSMIPRPYLH